MIGNVINITLILCLLQTSWLQIKMRSQKNENLRGDLFKFWFEFETCYNIFVWSLVLHFQLTFLKQSTLIVRYYWYYLISMTTWMNSRELDLENLEESNNKDGLKSKMENCDSKLFWTNCFSTPIYVMLQWKMISE